MQKHITPRMQVKFTVSHAHVHAEGQESVIKQNNFGTVHLQQHKEGE